MRNVYIRRIGKKCKRLKKRILPACVFSLFLFLCAFLIRFAHSSLFREGLEKWGQDTKLILNQENVGSENKKLLKELAEADNGMRVILDLGTLSENSTCMELPLELYVAGALAGSMEVSYELEALKAQAIVLRTSAMRRIYETGGKDRLSQREGRYETVSQMQKRWGKDYEMNYQKILQATLETEGVIMSDDGVPIVVAYHGMSMGATRDPALLSEAATDYIKSVSCNEVVFCRQYRQTKYVAKEQFDEPSDYLRDNRGYLLKVTQGKQTISGEEFRKRWQMPSANITWEKEENGYLLTSIGMGHGFGFDECYGNCLAKRGWKQTDILDFFFTNYQLTSINTNTTGKDYK